ncbi:MAG: aminoacyl-tRNA hydrolase [Christensenellaceae bacterium]
MYFIFGLGNPGLKYKNTRHNAGFCAIDVLSKKYDIKLKESKFNALVGQGSIDGQKVMLIKPTTFMNESGYAVDAVMNYYNGTYADMIVLYDDIDIPFGTLRIRDKGSAGTHNGMRSIISYLKTGEFARVRIGIGKPNISLIGYVLGKFEKEQRTQAAELFENAADACVCIIKNGLAQAQAAYN